MYSSKRNFYYYMLNNIVLGIIPFISISIFSRILTPQDYGLYALYLITGTVFSTIINFGLPAAHEVMCFEQKNYDQRIALTFSFVTFIIILSIVAFIPVYLFEDLILRLIVTQNYSQDILYLSCISSILFSLNFYFYNLFRNNKDGKSYLLFRSLSGIITLLISIYLILIYEYSFEGFFLSTLLTSALFLIFFIIKFRFKFSYIRLNLIKESFKITTPLLPKIIFGLVRTNYDRILLNNISSQSLVGIYDLGLKVSNQGTIIITSLYNSFIPNFYDQLNKKIPGYKTTLPNSLMKSFGIYFLVLLFISFFSFEIFYITTPKTFHEAINISSIIAVTLSFNFIEYIPVLLFLKKTNLITYLSVITSTMIFIAGIIFGIQYGIYGFILSNLILGVFSSIIYFTVYQKNLKLNWPLKKILIIYSYLIISSGIIIIFRIIEIEYIIRLLIKISLIIGSLIILTRLKVFIKEDFIFIYKRIKPLSMSK